jgi:hypothetical protein
MNERNCLVFGFGNNLLSRVWFGKCYSEQFDPSTSSGHRKLIVTPVELLTNHVR